MAIRLRERTSEALGGVVDDLQLHARMHLRPGTALLLSTVVEVSLGGFVPLRNADPFSNRPAALQKTRCHASRWAVRRRSLVSKMAAGEQSGRKKVAMFDATNTTRERRRWVIERSKETGAKVRGYVSRAGRHHALGRARSARRCRLP